MSGVAREATYSYPDGSFRVPWFFPDDAAKEDGEMKTAHFPTLNSIVGHLLFACGGSDRSVALLPSSAG
jgi:hypothetical protein